MGPRRSHRVVTVRATNLARHVDDDGVERFEPVERWDDLCAALADAAAAHGRVRHVGVGHDPALPATGPGGTRGAGAGTWVCLADVDADQVDALRTTIAERVGAFDVDAVWVLDAEPAIVGGAFLQAKPR